MVLSDRLFDGSVTSCAEFSGLLLLLSGFLTFLVFAEL